MATRLDWNDIRARAAKFAEEWKDAHYERGETQTFYNEFFELFGVTRRRLASFEYGVKLPENKRGFLDLFWKGKLLIEQKSKGQDLKPAREQALKYFPGLKEEELPRYILLSDFQNFELYDLDIDPDKPLVFKLDQLPDHVQSFGFIVGLERRLFRDQDPANIQASEIMGALHDALEASGYDGHNLERFLVRLLFCLFSDDTGIFQPLGIFEEYVANTREDGADVGGALAALFQVLNTKENARHKTISAELNKFPYVNGDLFAENLPLPHFDRDMRNKLLAACGFKWEAISPAIFGALFQSVMNTEERRKKGAHYTSEKNILKVIEPLFMDDLKAEFERITSLKRGRDKALDEFHTRLSKLTFFDPACGCGNFLVIAYRELRELETRILKELHPEQRVTDIGLYTRVNVDQFYGIEIEEFPARIAEVAMWMTDHIENVRLSAAFGEAYTRIPLTKSPNIRHADALETDWSQVISADKCSFVFGNPPFVGAKYQSEQQREQVRRIAALGGSGGSLDYVCAWFIKAGQFTKGSGARIAFVATNSVTQGEQVGQLWPVLFDRCKLEISFAHRTFQWLSDARGQAHVHCVIIGLSQRNQEPSQKRLFSYLTIDGDPVESSHSALSPYLIDASRLRDKHLVVRELSRSISGAPAMIIGSKPIDGGYLILDTPEEKAEFLAACPSARPFVKPFIGGQEYLNGGTRWILALQEASPAQLRAMSSVSERLKFVREYRLGRRPAKRKQDKEAKKPGISARGLADTPAQFHVTVIPKSPILVVPEVSSETRRYIPMGWLEPPIIPSNKLRFIKDADLYQFGVMSSAMHMAWTTFVGGRLESRFQYSIGINYNAFPWPAAPGEKEVEKVRTLAKAVLDARKQFPDSSLADIYDATSMPPVLLKAHRALDVAVDRIYRKEPFGSDGERVEHLFKLYEDLIAPMFSVGIKRRKRMPSGKSDTSSLAAGE
ncbi:class I SAM-dependent DNA methyltransferase [Bradyrhizobium sp. CNPSo 4010]|uniref:site-specific DNA-methyltransferase (adenine-specific) n=1 Tax=Bradyrhizobium agreste TaxID=2751811 RepID=A0ABS0PTB9_9BRAD|nr:DNA methyltransferase [Bradyrhizobium agreste]MBH5400447.1 class I SAM-dependent DNA methyltransferase [Bradyrhizobium agreste]